MLYPPYPNELLSSWIIRNSIAQGSDPMGWIYGFWGEWRAWTRDIDRYLPKDKIYALSKFCRLPYQTIYDMTLTPSIEKIKGELPSPYAAWDWIIPMGKRNRSVVHGLYFCPLCLREKHHFFPKNWRFSWHTACPVHHILLQCFCDTCHQPFSPYLVEYTAPYPWLCTRCGKNLRTVSVSSANPQLIHFQNFIDTVLAAPSFNTKILPEWKLEDVTAFFDLLHDLLSLPRMMRRAPKKFIDWQNKTFGKVLFSKIDSASGQTFDMLPVKIRSELLIGAGHILHMSPQHLTESLQKSGFTRSRLSDKHYPRSDMMKDIIQSLASHALTNKKRILHRPDYAVEPCNIDEVNIRMQEIREYLQ